MDDLAALLAKLEAEHSSGPSMPPGAEVHGGIRSAVGACIWSAGSPHC